MHRLLKNTYNIKSTRRKTKPDLVISYDIWPGNRVGLFW